MKELSLFTGGGGGLLASHLLGWTPIGYVEFNDYAQRIIAARIRDGYLRNAPIFGDIRAFIRDGYAESYQGLVDIVSGGFPCQPFSLAGKQLGADDPRNMWPQTIDVIGIVRPRYVFLENVPPLVSSGYIVTVIDELREAGYQVLPPLRLSASDIGANHKRERIWIVAYADSYNRGASGMESNARPNRGDIPGRSSQILAVPAHQGNSGRERFERDGQIPYREWGDKHRGSREDAGRQDVANTKSQPERKQTDQTITKPIGGETWFELGRRGQPVGIPSRQGLAQWQRAKRERTQPAAAGAGWWTVEPDVGRVAHELATGMDVT